MPEETDDGRASSPEDVCIQPQIITVKFQISETQIVAQVYPNCLTLSEVKIDIARKFEVDPDSLGLFQNDEELPLTRTLLETCKNEYGIVEFSLRIIRKTPIFSDEKIPELNLQIYYNKFRLADFVVVHIPAEESADGNSRDIVVEIQNKAIIKPFCGGYRDPKTNIDYYDAFTQTGPVPDKFKYEHIVSRDCQTVSVHTKSVETVQEHSTQSFGTATQLIHVTAATDYTISPKKYETYCEKTRRENKLAKVILIQRNFRAYLLRRFMRNAASEYRKLVEEQQRRDSRIKEKYLNKIHKECVTKTFPKTKDDFDLLYAQVQKWKEAEIKRIYSMYSDGPRIAEINCLLDKEIELLNGIENQRKNVCKALREYRDDQILKKLGEPVKWVGYRNKVVEMDLLRNQRVRNLTAFYKEMQKPLGKDERIELLEKLSALLRAKENHPLLPELMDLFEREKSLIVCAKSCDLTVLRQRQLVIFFEIIKNEREYKPKKPEMSMCEICKTVKPVKDFAIRTRQNVVDTCKRCFYLKGTAADNSIYKQMLRAVQRDERRRGTLSSYAFIMQEDDIRFLVEKVWHGHSALSKCNDITELRLPRWIIGDEWSPWNCVCLTEAETRVHIHLKELSHLYEEKLLEAITTKNFLAKNTFKKLQEVDSNFVETGEWSDVGIKEKVV